MGFEEDEALLPYPPQSFVGYRLLTEFFTFPQKFLFFDLALGDSLDYEKAEVDLHIYLKRDSGLKVNAQNLVLGCTPIVNLFERTAPTAFDPAKSEYRVVPDERRPKAFEVYSIDNVTINAPDGKRSVCEPLYGIGPVSQEFISTPGNVQQADINVTGELKKMLIEKMNVFLEDHMKRRSEAKKKLDKFITL